MFRGENEQLLPALPVAWKHKMARMMRLPGLPYLMSWGVRLTVPRQRLGVSLVALDDNGRVLLLRHVFHHPLPWGLPGGWLARNEAPEVGVLRELREETGLTADLGPIVHLAYLSHPPHLGIAFVGRLRPGSFTLNSEIIEAAWFPLEKLPPLFPFAIEAIKLAGQLQTAPPF
jgi:8-oxo-dGTP diphosphatase